MKKNLMFLLAFLFITINAKAESIWMSAAQIVRGETATAEVYLDNPSSVISGFQFDLTLPEGVTPVTSSTGTVTVTASSRLGSSYTLRGRRQNGNTYRFLYLSTSGAGISGNSGRIFSISLTASETAPCGNYKGTVLDVTLTKKDGTEITPAATNFDISLAHNLTYTEGKFPTCTEDGHEEYWHCALCNKYFADESGVYETTLEELAKSALGHVYDYDNIDWTWNIGWTECTAKLLCLRCNHSVSSPATVTIEDTTPATHTHAGVRTYTATAILLGKTYTNVKTEEIPVTGHTYGAPTWTWNGYSSATATFTCDGGDDTQVVNATITSEIIEATCEANGQRIYTASVTFQGNTYTDTRTVVTSATGHAYDFDHIKWDWNGYSSATATFTCKNGDNSQVVTATVTSEVTNPATCQYPGTRTYTASVTFQNHVYSDVKLEVIPATGDHTYGEPVWTWTGYTAAVANFSCTSGDSSVNVEAVITSELVLAATCDAAGSKKYTATVTFNNIDYTDVVTEELAALGHSYGEPIWTWSDDGKTASAKIVCAHDANHVVEGQAVVTSAVNTPVTCTTNGSTLYTAKVTLLGREYTSTKVVEDVIAPGHTLTAVTAKPATCTEPGNKAYWYCSVCKKYFSDAECQYETILEAQIIPATGHTLVCTDNGDGTHTTVCEHCDYHEIEDHVFDEGVCSVCGAKESNDTDPGDYADVLYITKKNVCIGNTTVLSLNLKNTSIAATGFETEIVLPEGFSVPVEIDKYGDSKLKIELSTDRTNSSRTNNFMTSILPNGNVKILCYSSNGYAFGGNDGEVARITIELDHDVAEGDYTIELVHNVASNASKTLYLPDAAVTLNAISYTLGDANGDNYINVGDLTAIASHILGVTPDNFIMGAADANVDNFINVGDLTFIANMILTGAVSQAKPTNFDASGMSAEVIGNGNEVVVPVNLDYFDNLSGYQFDVVVPEGYSLKSVTPANSCDFFEVSELENGIYRVLAYSLSNNNVMSANSELAVITLSKRNAFVGGDIMICNGFVADANRTLSIEPVSVSDDSVTAIEAIIGSADSYVVYDLAGKCIMTDADTKDLRNLKNGVYIINGVKVIK